MVPGLLLGAQVAHADVVVGFVTALSGPGSSIGIPYGTGIAAAYAYRSEIGGQKVKLIQLDDGSDPSAATRNAHKLIEDEKVDVLIGTAPAPAMIAMTAVAAELNVPMIALNKVSFEVRSGEILGLIGPNGAGKSTMFNLLTGALRIDSGQIAFGSQPIGRMSQARIARAGLRERSST